MLTPSELERQAFIERGTFRKDLEREMEYLAKKITQGLSIGLNAIEVPVPKGSFGPLSYDLEMQDAFARVLIMKGYNCNYELNSFDKKTWYLYFIRNSGPLHDTQTKYQVSM